MKPKPILVAAFLALTRPAAAYDPGDIVTQKQELVVPGVLGRPAIEVVVSNQPGERHPNLIVEVK
jgi:hypothetical protein